MRNKKTYHRYSTYTLFFFIVILSIGYAVSELSGEDLDDICDTEGDMLIKYGGIWTCTNDVYLENDLRFPISMILTKGQSNLPEYEAFKNDTMALAFDPTTLEQGYVSMQMPHGILSGEDLNFHFHWTPSTIDSGDVAWCIEITCANINNIFHDTLESCVIDTADEVLFKHQMTDYIVYTNALTFSAQCQVRLYRNATDARDTYTEDAYLHEFDVNYRVINIGDDA